jgi:KAP family P-loop domain
MSWYSKVLGRRKVSSEDNKVTYEAVAPAAESTDDRGPSVTDNPIRTSAHDRIGRAQAAERFAESVLRLDAREGLVIGVLGPWGSGKTSFINLSRPVFGRSAIAMIDFNPWMFSGAEQLVQSFFSELSAQLKLKPGLAEVGKRLEDYGDVFSNLTWLPFVGPWIERGQDLTKLVGGILKRKKDGVGAQRAKVDKALREIQKPVVVVLDDIDRLSTAEIRDIFRLVRLTASFPNIIYLLAFDRKRVEDALSDQGVHGRAYLEKILQLGFDLPTIPEKILDHQIFEHLNAELVDSEIAGKLNTNVWSDVFVEVVKPLITNMRDVRRYATAVGGTVRSLDGQIALADVLGLEAIRVFLPDVFARLQRAVDVLTTPSERSYGGRGGEDSSKTEIQSLIESAGDRAMVVKALINRLFMAAQRHTGGMFYDAGWAPQWLRDRRAAHAHVLSFYFERIAGDGLLAFNRAETAWKLMADAEAFSAYLNGLDRDQIEDTIASLETFEREVAPGQVLPGVVTLLNILPSLPEKERGFFGFDARTVVARVVYRLIRSQNSEEFVEAVVREALPKLETAYAKLDLIRTVGHREGVGHKLVPEAVAQEFERTWRAEFRALPVEELAREPDLLRSFLIAKRESEEDEAPVLAHADILVTRKVLLSSRSDVRSQSFGSHAVKKSARLAWKPLVGVYGTEEVLRQRIEELKSANFEDCEEVIGLADRYLGGWRPKEFDDE